MQNYIVLRRIPPVATNANTLTSSLHGLTINVYDVCCADADRKGAPIEPVIGAPLLLPGLPPLNPATQIVQHNTLLVLDSVETASSAVTLQEIGNLTLDQFASTAYAIVREPQLALPRLPDIRENLFTDGPNIGYQEIIGLFQGARCFSERTA